MSEGWLGFEADFVHLRKAFSLLAKLSGIYSKLHYSRLQVYMSFCGEVLHWYWNVLQNWSRRACQRVQPFSCRKKTNHSRWIAFFFYFSFILLILVCFLVLGFGVFLLGMSHLPVHPLPKHTPALLSLSGCRMGFHQVEWGDLSSSLALI